MKLNKMFLLVVLLFNSAFYSFAQITFEKTFGGTEDDWGLSVQQTSDEGYIIAGNTLSFGAGSRDVYLIKTNSLGDTLWTKTFGGIGTDEGHCVRQTYDGGYIITGINGTHYPTKGYLIKTDTTGDTLWAKTFDGSGESIIQTSDSVYVIVGTYAGDVYIKKTNSQGKAL